MSKTVSTSVHSIHPGDTVIVRGSQGGNGSITASSISISSAGSAPAPAARADRAAAAHRSSCSDLARTDPTTHQREGTRAMSSDTPEQRRPASRHRLRRLLATAAIASLVVVALAACGSSGRSTSSTATNSASTSNPRRPANRFASLRACLQKEGINLPSAPSGGPAGGGEAPGRRRGGFKLPKASRSRSSRKR